MFDLCLILSCACICIHVEHLLLMGHVLPPVANKSGEGITKGCSLVTITTFPSLKAPFLSKFSVAHNFVFFCHVQKRNHVREKDVEKRLD